MKALVCAASKYGATSQIAQAVADVLSSKRSPGRYHSTV